MPTLPILSISAAFATDGVIVVSYQFADNTVDYRAMVDGAEWEALAKNLEPHEWAALGTALRKLGTWVAV